MKLVSKNHQKDLPDCRHYMGKLWRNRKKKKKKKRKPRVRERKDRKRQIREKKSQA